MINTVSISANSNDRFRIADVAKNWFFRERRGAPVLTVLILFFCSFTVCYAAKVDTLSVPSHSMNKGIKTVVILPQNYSKEINYPVLYLLHGYSGNYSNWIKNSSVGALVDQYGYVVVCPDGGFGSWYWDMPNDKNYQYETFVSKELVEYIDQHYSTIKTRDGRAITGLSMGGHGALSLAIKHQDIYGAAGSTAGGVDFRPFPMNWEIKDRIGNYADVPQEWDSRVVINMVPKLVNNKLRLMIDCGKEDFFYAVNVALHDKLMYHNINHTFVTSEGGHNWEYWSRSIVYQMAFFKGYFGESERNKNKK
ncbi:alpha/beta hydrolase family protein [Sphingobacterium sp. 2149]|uniref:alpha/beta hydrolase n=1 Tax=Sphingobacterium sp. 2149 TaxID=2817763 RepID=UPI001B785EBE|nr:alpha/beta hydrolase family protein [Sphingobacterium sp. 2149]MDR6733643.1 S-formylglutathione hydrolase FrmB [Sphingobacterium sp. 2149]